MSKEVTEIDEYKLTFAHIEKLLDRRQSTTSFYLSVNTAIVAFVGLLLKDANLTEIWLLLSVVILLCGGLIACWIWRSLLQQYNVMLGWWYSRLRELEALIPDSAQLVTKEYNDLYLSKEPKMRIGMTKKEISLIWVFTGLYTIFIAGILIAIIF